MPSWYVFIPWYGVPAAGECRPQVDIVRSGVEVSAGAGGCGVKLAPNAIGLCCLAEASADRILVSEAMIQASVNLIGRVGGAWIVDEVDRAGLIRRWK